MHSAAVRGTQRAPIAGFVENRCNHREGRRTPCYSRSPQLFERLSDHFRYDSSVPNASGVFSTGSNSGCCTIFPYRAIDASRIPRGTAHRNRWSSTGGTTEAASEEEPVAVDRLEPQADVPVRLVTLHHVRDVFEPW